MIWYLYLFACFVWFFTAIICLSLYFFVLCFNCSLFVFLLLSLIERATLRLHHTTASVDRILSHAWFACWDNKSNISWIEESNKLTFFSSLKVFTQHMFVLFVDWSEMGYIFSLQIPHDTFLCSKTKNRPNDHKLSASKLHHRHHSKWLNTKSRNDPTNNNNIHW